MSVYIRLFLEFFKIGFLAIGGGMSTIPFLFDLSKKYPSWFTETELVDMIAVSESTPGPIGINMSTYCGVKVAGIWGGLISTFSLVLPSFIILAIIAKYLYLIKHPKVQNAMYGLRPVVVVLFFLALLNIFRLTFLKDGRIDFSSFDFATSINWIEVVLFAIVCALSNIFKKVASIYWVLGCAIISIFIF